MQAVDTYYSVGGETPTIGKDPSAKLDYPFDWTRWLTPLGDTIASVVWVAEAPLIVDGVKSGNDTTHATAWVSGGTVGKKHRLTCRITTAAGRIEDRSIFLEIVER